MHIFADEDGKADAGPREEPSTSKKTAELKDPSSSRTSTSSSKSEKRTRPSEKQVAMKVPKNKGTSVI